MSDMTVELPPFLAQMMQPPPPVYTEAEQAQVNAFNEAVARQQITERRQMLRFAAIFCTCDPWFDRSTIGSKPAPQATCHIHNMIALDQFEQKWFW